MGTTGETISDCCHAVAYVLMALMPMLTLAAANCHPAATAMGNGNGVC